MDCVLGIRGRRIAYRISTRNSLENINLEDQKGSKKIKLREIIRTPNIAVEWLAPLLYLGS
jgi:hypothetical protein